MERSGVEVERPDEDKDRQSTGVTAERVSIVPGVSILGVLGHLNYEPWFALAEYVDNAIQSASKCYAQIVRGEPKYRLRVDISYQRENGGRIVIADNAGGIAHQDFPRAFKAAEVPPDRSGLSEFGMGMKSASIWFARNWRVVTTSIGDPNEYFIEFNMESVLRDQVEDLIVTSVPAPSEAHYTRIELWDLNQFLPGRTMGKVRDHLREIYRGFLRDGRLNLTVAGQNMEYEEPEVLRAVDVRSEANHDLSKESKEWRKEVDFVFGDDIRVAGWCAIRAEGRTSGNGLSLFRRGRVIVGSGESPYRPTRIYGGGNSYRSQRLFGELEITGLPVSHTKDGFQWHGHEEEFEEKLRAALDSEPLPLLKQAEHYRARQASKQEQKRIRTATENTADVVEKELPNALAEGIGAVAESPGPTDITTPEDSTGDVEREFSFGHQGRTWTLRMTASSRPGETRWLVRHVEVEPRSGDVTAHVVLNTAHPFLKQFALGSTDAIEAVFRIAVAMVVSESVLNSSGDGESAGTFMRQVETLLSGALSKRLRSDA
ncbi:ATP-binding protein [Nocardioides sp. AE5]|uniref:ATP-binding protein n=1 Tax=Nocardioides sp. AE5 TaxID=2962573 RepID=UPI002880D014|nr:ATP-binding protein [Nocardioides sp. AE5]MDT0202404.1 ATP-binding protein [Nocardioides sp. AE5]